MGISIGKNISKNLVNIVNKNILFMLKNLQQMHLKLFQKESFKKQQKQLVILLVIKLLIKSKKFQKNLETVTIKNDKEIPKERYVSRKKARNYWWFKIKIIV